MLESSFNIVPALGIAMAAFSTSVAHVFSGPDHLAAVLPFSFHQQKRAWPLGVFWGMGHSVAVLSIGVIAFSLKKLSGLQLVSETSEVVAGTLLIAVGIYFVFKPHQREPALISKKSHLVTGSTGLVHGFAGSAHLFSIIPAITQNDTSMSVLYLLVFSLGSIASMAVFSHLVQKSGQKLRGINKVKPRLISISMGIISISVGIFWLV